MTTSAAGQRQGHLLHNLLLFGRALRGAGLAVDPAGMLTLVHALEHVKVGRRRDFAAAARCILVHRQQDLATFDEVFRVFWRQPKDPRSTLDLRSLGEQRRYRNPEVTAPRGQDDGGRHGGSPGDAGDHVLLPRVYSPREVLRTKDFSAYTAQEMEDARRMVAGLAWDVGRRRTRRWTPGSGRLLDLRRTLRGGTRHGGELFHPAWRVRREKPRHLVLLCDISGSMERYTRMLLHFLHTLAVRRGRLDAFVFATRLTRINRQLAHRGVDRAIGQVARAVPDWAGGTRIGEAVKVFNHRWSRRVLRSGSVVLVISDGWDRGDPQVLRREMARLQRSCHRLIWLNPLLGGRDYAPLTQGMQAAMPFVDDFLPVHNLASLEQLARHLNRLSARRVLRPQRPGHGPGAATSADTAGPQGAGQPPGHPDARPTFRHPLWGKS